MVFLVRQVNMPARAGQSRGLEDGTKQPCERWTRRAVTLSDSGPYVSKGLRITHALPRLSALPLRLGYCRMDPNLRRGSIPSG